MKQEESENHKSDCYEVLTEVDRIACRIEVHELATIHCDEALSPRLIHAAVCKLITVTVLVGNEIVNR